MNLARHLNTEALGEPADVAVIDALVDAVPYIDPWDGYDFDKTIAIYEKGDDKFSVLKLGAPIESMIEHIKANLASGKKCKIFTARVSYDDERINQAVREVIRAWCVEHIGVALEITCKKDIGMRTLYDDRARQVVENTGQIVPGPQEKALQAEQTAQFHKNLKQELGQD